MAERDSRFPDIRVPTLGGLNERPSPANLRPGEFDILEGLYPSNVGLLSRIPGKTFLAEVDGKVLQIYATGNVTNDVLIETDAGLFVFTLDELQGRAIAPALTYPPIPEEETMSMAIIVQKEASTGVGGSIQGYVSGAADTSSVLNTWYPRRLTHLLVNESSTVTTFTAAGAGAGAASSGSFVLSPGTYRISAQATFRNVGSAVEESFMIGLWNATTSTFEVQTGGTDPVIGIVASAVLPGSSGANLIASFESSITVSSSNKTFEIRQQCDLQATARNGNCCGKASGVTGTANGSAPPYYYAYIKILKTA